MARRDRERWLIFVLLVDGKIEDNKEREVRGKSSWETGTKENFVCESIDHPRTGGMNPDSARSYSNTRSSQSSQACRIHDLSCTLVSSTWFSSSSLISLFLVHNSTIIAEYNVKSSSLSLNVIIMSWHQVQHIQSTVYTENSIHWIHHTPKIVCLPFIPMITS